MNDKTKTLLCLIIVVLCVVVYITFACLPSWDELREMRMKCKTVCKPIHSKIL